MTTDQSRPAVLHNGQPIVLTGDSPPIPFWDRLLGIATPRMLLAEFLVEHPELPFEFAPPQVEGIGVTAIWYRRRVWKLPQAAATHWLAMELDLPAPVPNRDRITACKLPFPEGFFDAPDAVERVQLALLKLERWHDDPEMVAWGRSAPVLGRC